MKSYLPVLVLTGLVVSLGCGDVGGRRRNASGTAGGAGLVAPDQQVAQPAPAAAEQPPAMPSAAFSAAAQLSQGGAAAPAAQPGAGPCA